MHWDWVTDLCVQVWKHMGRKLLKTVQTLFGTLSRTPWEPVADPLWSTDPSLKTADVVDGCPDPRTERGTFEGWRSSLRSNYFVTIACDACRFKRVHDSYPAYRFPFIVWDLLQNGGASQIHTHFHVMMTKNRYRGTLMFSAIFCAVSNFLRPKFKSVVRAVRLAKVTPIQ